MVSPDRPLRHGPIGRVATGRDRCSHGRNSRCDLREYGSTLQTAELAGTLRVHDVFWEDRRTAVGKRSLMQ
jgi:hypothetical protein